MDPLVALILYGFSAIAGMVVLTLTAQLEAMQSLFFRVLSGGSAGGLTGWYLTGVSPMLSFLEYSVNGKLGAGGYLFVLSLLTVLAVWAWNLINYRGVIVR